MKNNEIKLYDHIFTGYYSSANGPLLYDENKRCMFYRVENTKYWKQQPKIGDKISLTENQDVYINDVLVFENTKEIQEAKEKAMNDFIEMKIKELNK